MEQLQLSQPFLTGEVFQLSDHCCGLLWTLLSGLQQVHICPVLRALDLDARLLGGSHQGRVEGQNPLPCPAVHTAGDAAQVMVGLLGCKCTLPVHVQLFIHQYSQVLLSRAALNLFIPQPLLTVEVTLTHVQDPAFGLVEAHEVHMGPLLELFQVPLDGGH